MKRLISLVCGSLVLLVMFLAPGNAVQAEEACECPGTVLTGAERNKLVAELLKSDVFKQARIELENEGYVWQGAGAIEVRNLEVIAPSLLGYQVMIINETGNVEAAAFMLMDGSLTYMGHAPLDVH